MTTNVPTSIGSNSSPEEVAAFAEAQGMTPEDLQEQLGAMFGGRFHNQLTLAGVKPSNKTPSPYEQALAIVREDSPLSGSAKRLALADHALKIYPNCAEAYILRAKAEKDYKKQVALVRDAVAAGERHMGGKQVIKDDAGFFWQLLETRPYLKARFSLAHALWIIGQCDEAIQELKDIIHLNPNDNLGTRHTLMPWLLMVYRHEDAKQVIDQFADDWSAVWHYMRALWAFRTMGDTDTAQAYLKDAINYNKHIAKYLLKPESLPEFYQPSSYAPGSDDEALLFMDDNGAEVWTQTPGAIYWLKTVKQGSKPAITEDVSDRAAELQKMVETFCKKHLNDEYNDLCTKLVKAMAQRDDISFAKGKLEIWAAAVVCAIGSYNFLYDKTFKPYMQQKDILKAFGVSTGSVSTKVSELREAFDLQFPFGDDTFLTQRMIDENPLNKMGISPEGFIHMLQGKK
jgi:tetratricopeptide (TPR) repeat protein